MKNIPFKKMHGSGNDFILIDNRQGLIKPDEAPELASRLCRRGFGIGADGLILIEDSKRADFKWRFLNADGSLAEMCGNGGRCAARFARIAGICKDDLTFETKAGIIKARVKKNSVKLQLTRPRDIKEGMRLDLDGKEMVVDFADTGVPHAVLFCQDVEGMDVKGLGKEIRNHPFFQPAGTNVNFVQVLSPNQLKVRTYERGVEDETYACGTGASASALLAGLKGLVSSPVQVVTSGGERLLVHFDTTNLDEIYLEGNAVLVYSGVTEEI